MPVIAFCDALGETALIEGLVAAGFAATGFAAAFNFRSFFVSVLLAAVVGVARFDAAGVAAAVALGLGFVGTAGFGLVASATAAVFATAFAADCSAGTAMLAVLAAVPALLTAVDLDVGRAR